MSYYFYDERCLRQDKILSRIECAIAWKKAPETIYEVKLIGRVLKLLSTHRLSKRRQEKCMNTIRIVKKAMSLDIGSNYQIQNLKCKYQLLRKTWSFARCKNEIRIFRVPSGSRLVAILQQMVTWEKHFHNFWPRSFHEDNCSKKLNDTNVKLSCNVSRLSSRAVLSDCQYVQKRQPSD